MWFAKMAYFVITLLVLYNLLPGGILPRGESIKGNVQSILALVYLLLLGAMLGYVSWDIARYLYHLCY